MLIFNCTKAATDFFTTTRTTKGKKEKHSPIEPAPHKTISESIADPIFPDDIVAEAEYDTEQLKQWQWLIHVIKVKRKNILIVMDYHSRFSITLTGLKKGDNIAFLNMFEHHLNMHIHEIMSLVCDDSRDIDNSLENYFQQHNSCAFHQRSDRSVQTHINDVKWHFEMSVDEIGAVPQEENLIGFDLYINRMLRKTKLNKNYFYPQHAFLHTWLSLYADMTMSQANKKINILKEQEKSAYQAEHEMMMATLNEQQSEQNLKQIFNVDTDSGANGENVVSLEAFKKAKKRK